MMHSQQNVKNPAYKFGFKCCFENFLIYGLIGQFTEQLNGTEEMGIFIGGFLPHCTKPPLHFNNRL
jgi:hypothetical protein